MFTGDTGTWYVWCCLPMCC